MELVEVQPKSIDTIATEHTKDVSLLLGKLWRSFPAECCETLAHESLNAGQTQMGQARTVVQ